MSDRKEADNDAEFDEYGGNTAAREQFETAQWTGKFKCRKCGEPITDSYPRPTTNMRLDQGDSPSRMRP